MDLRFAGYVKHELSKDNRENSFYNKVFFLICF